MLWRKSNHSPRAGKQRKAIIPRFSHAAPKTEDDGIGGRVRSLRQQRGMTIEELFSASKLTKSFVSKIEPASRSVDLDRDAAGGGFPHYHQPALGEDH